MPEYAFLARSAFPDALKVERGIRPIPPKNGSENGTDRILPVQDFSEPLVQKP